MLSGLSQPTSSKEIILKGSSIFQTLPQPRSCPKLDISLAYCICQYQYEDANERSFVGAMAEFAVKWINDVIGANNATELCVPLYVNQSSVKVEEFEPSFQVQIASFHALFLGWHFFNHIRSWTERRKIFRVYCEKHRWYFKNNFIFHGVGKVATDEFVCRTV